MMCLLAFHPERTLVHLAAKSFFEPEMTDAASCMNGCEALIVDIRV